MDLTEKVPKYSFYGFNAVYLAGCISILTFAGIIQYTVFYYDFFSDSVSRPSIVLFTSSSLLILAAAAGYFGAIRGKSWMLLGFAGTVGVFAIIQLIGGCMALSQEYEVTVELMETLQYTQMLYINGEDNQETKDAIQSWDYLQEEFHCCGVLNYTEWGNDIPSSCACNRDAFPCEGTVYSNGCYKELSNYVHYLLVVLGSLAISFFAVLLFSVGLAQMLARNVRQSDA